MIPTYNENDITHILEYYAQTGLCPQFYPFDKICREKLDVAKIAQEIWDKDMGEKAKVKYLDDLWDNGAKIFGVCSSLTKDISSE